MRSRVFAKAAGPASSPAAVQGNARAQETVPSFNATIGGLSCFTDDFSRIPIHSAQAPAAQTKLEVHGQRIFHEEEADQAAEQVMRMTDPGPPVSAGEDDVNASLMRKQGSEPQIGAEADIPPLLPSFIPCSTAAEDGLSTRPLVPSWSLVSATISARCAFTPIDQLADAARDVAARAFTVGEHIVFGDRQFAPDSTAGRRLLAHRTGAHHPAAERASGGGNLSQPIPVGTSLLRISRGCRKPARASRSRPIAAFSLPSFRRIS